MTMIEKMATAMCVVDCLKLGGCEGKGGCWYSNEWLPEARAALAVLLEPSPAMLKAAWDTLPDKVFACDGPEAMRPILVAAIQAALDEEGGG